MLAFSAVAMMSLLAIQAPPGAPEASVTVIDIPSPQAFVAEIQRSGKRVVDVLAETVRPGTRTFIVVPRRDGGWIGEIRPTSSQEDYQRTIRDAAAVAEESSRLAVISSAYRDQLLALQRNVREETGGFVLFTYIHLGARDLISSPELMAASPPPLLLATAEARDYGKIPHPLRSHVYRGVATVGATFLVGLVAVIAILIRQAALRRREDAILAHLGATAQTNKRDDPQKEGARSTYAPRRQAREPLFATVPNRRLRSAPVRRFITTVGLLVLFIPAKSATPQSTASKTAGTAAAIAVDIGARHESTHSRYVTRSSTRSNSGHLRTNTMALRQSDPDSSGEDGREVEITVDASGSIYDQSVAAGRTISAAFLRAGRPVRLITFGDSLTRMGPITTTARSDSIFSSLPRQSHTRLSDAILATIDTAPATRSRLKIFISDFKPDDSGNESLRFLPMTRSPTIAIAAQANSLRTRSGLPLIALLSSISAFGVCIGAGITRFLDRHRRGAGLPDRVRLSVRGRIRQYDIPVAELTKPLLLVGDEAGALFRTHHGEDATEIELSAQFDQSNTLIIIGQRVEGGANQLQLTAR